MNYKISQAFCFIILVGCAHPIYKDDDGVFLVGVKNSKWFVVFPQYQMKLERLNGNEKSAFGLFTHNSMGLSLFIGPAQQCSTGFDCRDISLTRIKLTDKIAHDTIWNTDEASYAEYFTPEVSDHPLKQLHIHKYIVRDGYLFEIHMSQLSPDDKIEERFIRMIENAKLVTYRPK